MGTPLNDTFSGDLTGAKLSDHVSDSGTTWLQIQSGGIDPKLTPSGTVYPNGAGVIISNGIMSSPDYTVSSSMIYKGGTINGIGICARMNLNATIDGYVLRTADATINMQLNLYKFVSGVASLISSSPFLSAPITASKMTVMSLSGSNIKVSYDSSNLFDFYDPTPISRVGYAGIRTSSVGSSATGIHLDQIYVQDNNNTYSITGSDITDRKVFRRSGTTSTISFSGSFSGTPAYVQVGVFSASGTQIVGYTDTTLNSPNTFIKTLTVPQSAGEGWYSYKAQTLDFNRNVVSNWSGTNKWGVGMILAYGGQSNCIGYGDTNFTTALDTVSVLSSGNVWKYATEPIIATKGANSAIPCANKLTTDIGVPIGIVMSPDVVGMVGGAGTNWGYRNPADHKDPTTVYGRMLTQLISSGGCNAFIWSQGATDAIAGVSKSAYLNSINAVKGWFEEDLGYQIPWVLTTVGRTKTVGAWDTGYNDIRQAHIEWDNGVNQFNACDTLDYPIINGDIIGGFTSHYGGDSMRLRSLEEAKTLKYYFGYSSIYGAPRITSLQFTDTSYNAIKVTILHRGGSDFTPSVSIIGFVVTDTVGQKTITSAVRVSPTTLYLILSSPCVGNTTTTYLAGRDPAGPSGLIHDDQTSPVMLRSMPYAMTVSIPNTTRCINYIW